MKILALITITLLLSGCYTTEDAENDRRQDLIGFILGLDGDTGTEYNMYTQEDYERDVQTVHELKNR